MMPHPDYPWVTGLACIVLSCARCGAKKNDCTEPDDDSVMYAFVKEHAACVFVPIKTFTCEVCKETWSGRVKPEGKYPEEAWAFVEKHIKKCNAGRVQVRPRVKNQ